jgi:predicted alpha/beta hydrolase
MLISWLAQEGVGVITYDYRYNGLSWPTHLLDLVGSKASSESRAEAYRAVPEDVGITSHWAQRDASAAVRYASMTWPNVPLTSLGHSLGGSELLTPLREFRIVPLQLMV